MHIAYPCQQHVYQEFGNQLLHMMVKVRPCFCGLSSWLRWRRNGIEFDVAWHIRSNGPPASRGIHTWTISHSISIGRSILVFSLVCQRFMQTRKPYRNAPKRRVDIRCVICITSNIWVRFESEAKPRDILNSILNSFYNIVLVWQRRQAAIARRVVSEFSRCSNFSDDQQTKKRKN